MSIHEGITDALRHLDVRFQSLVISREKEKMTTEQTSKRAGICYINDKSLRK